MSFEKIALAIPEIFELRSTVFADARGTFVKSFAKSVFDMLGVEFAILEQFYSKSKKGTIRGFHFQVPPKDQTKIVTCLDGEVLDVIVDIRTGSHTYGKLINVKLTSKLANCVVIPSGFAHGFQALTDDALMLYNVSTEHDPVCDKGLRYDSVGFQWPISNPTVSDRDQSHPKFSDYKSPFEYKSGLKS